MISTNEKTRIEFYLDGEDAVRFLDFKKDTKCKNKTQAAYKLLMEGLDRHAESKNNIVSEVSAKGVENGFIQTKNG